MDFKRVVEGAVELQNQLPWLEMVVVGGTAAAVHAHHRYSIDADCVTPFLKETFDVVSSSLDDWEGWQTNRVRRPVVILGERHGVQLGIRQLRRTVALDTQKIGGLLVPTPEEALRIKAYLLTERGAMRDFIDVAALSDLIGPDRSIASLKHLNELYEPSGQLTRLSTFSQAVFDTPRDFDETVLHTYKGIQPPYNRWLHVEKACCQLGAKLAEIELSGELVNLEPLPLPRITDLKKPHISDRQNEL